MCSDTTNDMLEVMRKTAGGLTTAQQLKAVEKEIQDFQLDILQRQPGVRPIGDILEGATLTEEELEEYQAMLSRRKNLLSQSRS